MQLTIITIKLNNVAGLRKSMNTIACGTPVVAFNIGGNSDMIDHSLMVIWRKPGTLKI